LLPQSLVKLLRSSKLSTCQDPLRSRAKSIHLHGEAGKAKRTQAAAGKFSYLFSLRKSAGLLRQGKNESQPGRQRVKEGPRRPWPSVPSWTGTSARVCSGERRFSQQRCRETKGKQSPPAPVPSARQPRLQPLCSNRPTLPRRPGATRAGCASGTSGDDRGKERPARRDGLCRPPGPAGPGLGPQAAAPPGPDAVA